ncbi:MAG: hypothetical protein QM785_11710 [Pyrinomonadaceae bacterium]
MYRNYIREFAVTLLFSTFLLTAIPIDAQKAKPASNKGSSGNWAPPKSQGCQGGWRGVVRIRKTLNDSLSSDEPGIRKDIDRIKHITSRRYSYTGTAIVDGADPKNTTVRAKVAFTDVDKNWGEERVFDTCNSRENGHWFVIEGTNDRVTEANAEGPASSFNLSVDELSGNYSFNVKLPTATGTFKREEHVKKTGHCQAKNNEPFDRSTNDPFKIEGESVSIYDKLDPKNPDQIEGSKSWGDDGKGEIRGFVYTATWRFTRCPEQLLVTDVRFEHMKFPTWNNYVDITDENGTIDGNLVKVKANIVNLSSESKFVEVTFKQTYKGDKWDGAKPDYPLHEPVTIKLDAGEEREVEVLWNTQGFAWFDDGRPRYLQRVKVEAWEEFKKKDEMTKNLKISPKPLVIVGGIWTDPKIVELYQNLLTVSHSYGWRANRVVDVSSKGKITTEGSPAPVRKTKSVFDNADNLGKYVQKIQTDNNAWHVDMVGHSTGGLVARLFVHRQEVWPDGFPVVKHLMLLGTPNLGVPSADSLNFNDAFDRYSMTAKELMPDEMARFNQYVTQRKGTKFSALVGDSIPLLCATPTWNDGFVSVESAKFGIEDFAITKDSHPNLLEPIHFGEFIKPHIVTGPRGTYPLPIVSAEGGRDGRTGGN